MNQENKKLFLDYARTQVPREACAVLILENEVETLVICKNKAELGDFVIDKVDLTDAEERGKIIGIVHSHPNKNPTPSECDKVSCSQGSVKWYIVGTINGEWAELEPSGYKAPLIGREWAHGVLDCYALVRDYYKEILSIDLPDFERQHAWWEKGDNLFLDNFSKAGFIQVPFESIKKHDVILMQIKSKVINHGGIYLGDGLFLHHLYKKLSGRDIFGGWWAKNTIKVVRYKEPTNAEDKTLR